MVCVNSRYFMHGRVYSVSRKKYKLIKTLGSTDNPETWKTSFPALSVFPRVWDLGLLRSETDDRFYLTCI